MCDGRNGILFFEKEFNLMEQFSKEIQIRWSDLDPNFHLRHSVYYDWGAWCRVEFLNEFGLTAEVMTQ